MGKPVRGAYGVRVGSSRLVFVAVVVGALLGGALVGAMALTSGGPSTASVPQVGAQHVAAMLRGVRQQGTELGSRQAPVTVVEFADPQCPYCADWARVALPVLVRDYVRPGKVRIVFVGMHFVGPDSETALRAALAAALQGRFWNVLELLYQNQGVENTGWVNDSLLRSIGNAVPGLNTEQMLDGRQSPTVERLLAEADALAQKVSVNSTPTFAVGKTGLTLRIVPVSSLEAAALAPAIDATLRQ